MNHIGLYYFTVAAEELNITRAAAKLYISQQSLSEHIRKLEKQYDAVFFTRGGRLALTAQGRASGWVLALLPLALALILSILNPSYLAPLLEDQIGRVAIGVALVLELIGFFVIHRIVDIEV